MRDYTSYLMEWLDNQFNTPEQWSENFNKIKTFSLDYPDMAERLGFWEIIDIVNRNEKCGIDK